MLKNNRYPNYSRRLPPLAPLPEQPALDKTMQIEEHLGAGAFGDVFVAGNEPEKQYAVKVVPRRARDRDRVEALCKEGQALVKCEQAGVPHVIRLQAIKHDLVPKLENGRLVGLKEERPRRNLYAPRIRPPGECRYEALFLELAHEGSLASRIKKGPLPEAECRSLSIALLEALQKMHEDAGIIHRDIKPANIVFEGGEPKIIDLGVCSDKRRPLSAAGTPSYSAPEIWRNLMSAYPQSYDCRVDIWSLGVTLYEALTGRLPFRGKTRRELLEDVAKYLNGRKGLWFPEGVSEGARKFTRFLIQAAELRPTAREALRHFWVLADA